MGCSTRASLQSAISRIAADRRVDFPAAVGVDRQRDLGSDRLAHDAHALDVGRRVATDFDLDRGEAGRHELLGPRAGPVGFVGAHAVAAANRQRPARSAQQFIDRLALGLATNVPAGHFDRALGKPIVDAGCVHAPIDFDDVERIAADELRRQHALDQRLRPPHRLAAPARRHRRFAGPLDARVGQHPHQQILRDRVLPQRS